MHMPTSTNGHTNGHATGDAAGHRDHDTRDHDTRDHDTRDRSSAHPAGSARTTRVHFAPPGFAPNDAVEAPRPQRSLGARVSSAHLLAAACGLAGFAMTAWMLRDSEETVSVAVAAEDIAAGSAVDAAVVEFVDVAAGSPLAGRSFRPTADSEAVARQPIRAGDPILTSSVTLDPPAAGLVDIEVSVTATPSQLAVGDDVSVIGVVSQGSLSSATWLAAAVPVLAIVEDDERMLAGRERDVRVVLAVTGTQALALGAAQEIGVLMLVRSSADLAGIALDERVIVSVDIVGRQLQSVLPGETIAGTPATAAGSVPVPATTAPPAPGSTAPPAADPAAPPESVPGTSLPVDAGNVTGDATGEVAG
jgi:hypothetical protein